MAIPSSGAIALTALQTEFGGSNPISINEYYRGGGLVPNSSGNSNVPTSGAISLSNFYGSQNRTTINVTISSTTTNYNLKNAIAASYQAGISNITLTINSGVVVGATSVFDYALDISGFSSGDTISIVNNGTILGCGGSGGTGGNAISSTISSGSAGGNGGNAIYVNYAVSITNNGTIGGGGGGGGGGAAGRDIPSLGTSYNFSGGGGGGGAGYSNGSAGSAGTASGATFNIAGSGGSNGTNSSGGAGGAGGVSGSASAGNGGIGGALGASGSSGTNDGTGQPSVGGSGGSAGKYLVGNSFVTWVTTGTRYGTAS